MQLTIRHETTYRYTAPLSYSIQQLRLTPRSEPHQRVAAWHVHTSGKCHRFTDAFDNVCHMLTITGMHHEVAIVASGIIDVMPLDRGRLPASEILSPLVFSVPTRLTELTPVVLEFAHANFKAHPSSDDLLMLAERIQDAVSYQRGATAVTSTASDALHLGKGVCQDHAHLFLASCHAHGIPARYVSGYIDPGDTDHAESHAWIDAWIEEDAYAGWVSIDVTHARFAGDHYCRLAIGRDYESVAPVRGVRQGGGTESMSVHVDVAAAPAQG
jgi:transglutaminase-like putative cysteine protease